MSKKRRIAQEPTIIAYLRWEGDDTLDEHYDYYDLLPDGWEEIQSLGDEDGDNYNLPDEPVWEKGELIKLESDNKPMLDKFTEMHHWIRKDADQQAANAVLKLIEK